MPYRPVIFMHIGKTGGKSLEPVFQRFYPDHYLINSYANAQEKSIQQFIQQAKQHSFDALIGHCAFGLHVYMPRGCRYVTLMRDPVERILSDYSQILENPNRTYHEEIKQMTLTEYLDFDKIPLNVDNGQVRLLSGMADRPFGSCDIDMLDKAKENIEKWFLIVGLTEYFDESLLLIAESLQWETPPFYKRSNVTGKRLKTVDFDAGEIAYLREKNRLDIELYAWVKKRFEKTLSAKGEEFREKVKRFKQQNQQYNVPKGFEKLKARIKRLLK